MGDDFNFEEPTVIKLVLTEQRKKELVDWCKRNIDLDKFDLTPIDLIGNISNNTKYKYLWIFTNKEDYVNFQMSCL